jgi:hypothetical protein
LRRGEIAYLAGDLAEAEERWTWSYALRPTAWADRNQAILQLGRGLAGSAAVRYLRAHRNQPDEVELGVEAVGALIAARRARDALSVLDRMRREGQEETARFWLLQAEVALSLGHPLHEVERACRAATACADADVHLKWRLALLDASPAANGRGSIASRPVSTGSVL